MPVQHNTRQLSKTPACFIYIYIKKEMPEIQKDREFNSLKNVTISVVANLQKINKLLNCFCKRNIFTVKQIHSLQVILPKSCNELFANHLFLFNLGHKHGIGLEEYFHMYKSPLLQSYT